MLFFELTFVNFVIFRKTTQVDQHSHYRFSDERNLKNKCELLTFLVNLAKFWSYTVKLARAKLPANAGNFSCSLQVKRPHTQFICVTCSLPVKTGKFTCFYAASTSHRIHANCLKQNVNLLDYNGYFTNNFTCATHANLPVTSKQN